jgi:hypothetical protein
MRTTKTYFWAWMKSKSKWPPLSMITCTSVQNRSTNATEIKHRPWKSRENLHTKAEKYSTHRGQYTETEKRKKCKNSKISKKSTAPIKRNRTISDRNANKCARSLRRVAPSMCVCVYERGGATKKLGEQMPVDCETRAASPKIASGVLAGSDWHSLGWYAADFFLLAMRVFTTYRRLG